MGKKTVVGSNLSVGLQQMHHRKNWRFVLNTAQVHKKTEDMGAPQRQSDRMNEIPKHCYSHICSLRNEGIRYYKHISNCSAMTTEQLLPFPVLLLIYKQAFCSKPCASLFKVDCSTRVSIF
jgi:hypothetical protein